MLDYQDGYDEGYTAGRESGAHAAKEELEAAADKVRELEAEVTRLTKIVSDAKELYKVQHEVADDLRAKVQYLVDEMDRIYDSDEGKYLEDRCFTFPDGDTWYATGHEPQPKEVIQPNLTEALRQRPQGGALHYPSPKGR